jgi:hypothetical protein
MHRTLVDYARRHRTSKRGGQALTIEFEEASVAREEPTADLVAIDDALNTLAKHDARKSRIVELRFFGGFSVEETAEVLKISPRTVNANGAFPARGCIARWLGKRHLIAEGTSVERVTRRRTTLHASTLDFLLLTFEWDRTARNWSPPSGRRCRNSASTGYG